MAHFRKIDVRIWNDEKFHRLSNDGKLAFLYLLTHPMTNSLGVIRATSVGLAHEIGIDDEGFREGFREGLAIESEVASCIWIKNFLRYQTPESPNVVKAWGKVVDLIPECEVKALALTGAKDFTEGMSEAFRKAFAETFPYIYANKGERRKEKGERTTPSPTRAEDFSGGRVVSLAAASFGEDF